MAGRRKGKGGGKGKGKSEAHLAQECLEGGKAGKSDGKRGSKAGVCYNFRDKGECRFGASCRFSHNL